MQKSRKIFLMGAIVFFALLFYASYDIATRTTFPGSKPQLKERIEKEFQKPDSVKKDSLTLKMGHNSLKLIALGCNF